jgi:hypothetical protein
LLLVGQAPNLRRPPRPARATEKPPDALHHLFVVYQLAALPCRDAAIHALDRLRLPFEHAGHRFLHHLSGFFAFARGELPKLRFRMGCEIGQRCRRRPRKSVSRRR